MVGFLRNNPFSIMLGALIGLLIAALSPPLLSIYLADYDLRHPVWEKMRSTIISRTADTLVLDVSGTKVRACEFRRVTGYAQDIANGYIAVNLKRVDVRMHGMTRPVGEQYLGRWEIHPVPAGPHRVRLIAENECSDRLVLSTLVDMEIQ